MRQGSALRHNRIVSPDQPKAFDGFSIVQLTDLHVETNETAMERVIDLLGEARYDVCVLTGDSGAGPAVRMAQRSPGWRAYVTASKAQSTARWAITIRFAWCRDWRRWA